MQIALSLFWRCFKINVIAIVIAITFNVIGYIVILFIRNRNRLHLCCNRPMSGDQSEWQTCSYRNCRQQNQLLVIKFFLQKLHKRIGNTGIVIEKNGRRYVHDITQRASCLQRFATLLTKTNLYPGNVASFTLRLETRGEALDFFFAETINTFSLQVRSTNTKGRASPKIGVNRYRRQQRFDKLRYQHQDKKKSLQRNIRNSVISQQVK